MLKRMGDVVTRAIVIVPDGSNPTPQAKKLMDDMNRSSNDVFIQWFSENELLVDIIVMSKMERRFDLVQPKEKADNQT